jgi:aerotolerance regulator-like protein/VWA domain-containing protein
VGFLAPGFLVGLLAVGLPVWLHLLRQHKSIPLPFSSLMFFERRVQSSVKHRRLRYLLLLALRCAVLALLALAFANPYFNAGPSADARDKLVVLAVDNSFSMRQGGRLERAKREALSAAGSLGSGVRARVASFGSQVAMLNEASSDPAILRAAIQSIQPSDTRSSFAELARTLRTLSLAVKIPVEAHVFSDMQKTSWPESFADARLADGIKLVPHAVADKRESNLAVESVKAPRRIYDPKKVRIQAAIASYGASKTTRTVTLVVNGKELQSKSVEVPAGGRASVEFLQLDASYGLNKGEVRISGGDNFPDDDHFYFAVERADPRRVLFVNDGRSPRALLYFRTALDASNDAAFVVDSVHPEQAEAAGLSKYALVVLSDVGSVPASLSTALRAYVQAGGALWIALGRTSSPGMRLPVFDEAVADSRYSSRDADRFRMIGYTDPAHPSIRGANLWEGVKFYQSVRVEPGKSRVVARLTDETPVLLEKQIGEGRVLVFASTFDNLSNDFPLHPAFVPFVDQTVRYLSRMDDVNQSLTPGAFVELRTTAERGSAVEVLDPSGKRALTLEEAAKSPSLTVSQQGFYDVRRPSGRHELVAVNPDRQESDFETLPAETLALWQNTGQGNVLQSSGAAGESEKRPHSFWMYLAAALLVAAIAEAIVGNQHLAAGREEATAD